MFSECSNITTPSTVIDKGVACHILDSCDAVTCCAEIAVLKRYVYTSINFKTCDYLLEVWMEEKKFEFDLINYEWGILCFLMKLSSLIKV